MGNVEANEVGKYRKKRDSNKSNSKAKSRHKHEYISCLYRHKYTVGMNEYERISIGSYCKICGKIGDNIDENRKSSVRLEDGLWRMLSNEEIVENNSDLQIFDVDYYNQYVPISKGCD